MSSLFILVEGKALSSPWEEAAFDTEQIILKQL